METTEPGRQEEAVLEKEKKTISYLIIIPVLVVAVVVVLYMVFGEKVVRVKPTPLRIGDMAPDFTYPDLDGNLVSLSSYRDKKVVFINIWATWCPTCIEEMPSMEKLYQQLKGKDFEILAVSIDVLGEQVVRPFIEKYELTFPVLLDNEGKIKQLYATTGVPESFIVGKDGRIAFVAIGPMDWSTPETKEFFEKLMETNPNHQ
jgi:peroxiredoxin